MNPINADINLNHSNVNIAMNDKELEELKEQYIQIINNMDLLVEQLKNYEDDRNKILKILYSKYNIEDGLLDMDFEEDGMNDTIPDVLQPTNDFSSGNLEDLDDSIKEVESEINSKKTKAKKSTKASKTEIPPEETEPVKKPATKKKVAKNEEKTTIDSVIIEDGSKEPKKAVTKTKKSPKAKKTVEATETKVPGENDGIDVEETIIQETAKSVKAKTTKRKRQKRIQ